MSVLFSLLLLVCLFYTDAPYAKAIYDFWVEVVPRKISTVASYQFHFSLTKKISPGQWIALEFPPGTTLYPPIPTEEPAKSERLRQLFSDISVSLQGRKHSLTTNKNGSVLLKLFVSVAFDPAYQNVQLLIPQKAGLVTPSKEGIYSFKMATETEPIFVSSEPFQFVQSKLTTPVVTVDPPVVTKSAGYKIEFSLGNGGSLKKYNDFIQISFPSDTKLTKTPSEIEKDWITINNIPLLVKPEGGGRLLKLVCPFDLMDATKVVIKIDQKAGIQNPSRVGEYNLIVATSTDTNWEKSKGYSLWEKEPTKINSLSIQSIDITPNFANTIAVYKIKIRFGDQKLLKKGDSITLEFSFVDKPFIISINEPIPQEYVMTLTHIENPNTGSYHLTLYTNKEPNPVISDKFAILPSPLHTTLEISGGIQGTNNWYIVPPLITLVCSNPTARIEYWVDDKPEHVISYNGSIALKPGEYRTTIHYYSLTDTDKEEEKFLTVLVDTIAPLLHVVFDENPLQNPVIFTGITSPNCSVFLDQTPLQTDRQCKFSLSQDLKEIGPRCNLLESIDLAGNKTSKTLCYWFGTRIVFKINSTSVITNDKSEIMPVAPYVKSNITLVPFRFMGEKLQAKIQYETDPETKAVKTITYYLRDLTLVLTIGSTLATVNQQSVKMELPPEIVKGNTVVPQ
jgi:hypothetical protein